MHHVSTYSSHSLLYIFIQFIYILRTYKKGTSSESDIQIYTCLYVCIILVQWNYTVDVLESFTNNLQYMWLLDYSTVLHSWTILIACKNISSYSYPSSSHTVFNYGKLWVQEINSKGRYIGRVGATCLLSYTVDWLYWKFIVQLTTHKCH